MVHDCAMVLGTNAMEKCGLQTVHVDGTAVPPVNPGELTKSTSEYVV